MVGTYNDEIGVKDVNWLCPSGAEMTQEHWDDANARCFGMLLDGRAQESGIVRRGSDATMLLVYNSHYDGVEFTLPAVAEGASWERLLDTNQPDQPRTICAFDELYVMTGRSMAVFALMS